MTSYLVGIFTDILYSRVLQYAVYCAHESSIRVPDNKGRTPHNSLMQGSELSGTYLASSDKKGSHDRLVSAGGGSQRARHGIISLYVYNPATADDVYHVPRTR